MMKVELMQYASQLDHFGKALVTIGNERDDVVVLDPDVSVSTKTTYFAERFPERFFKVGISEQDMIGIASGLAAAGKTAIACGFSLFVVGRAWEQIANSVARQNLDVKIVGTHSGLSPHADGDSHQALGDVALMRVMPNIVVVVPADAVSAVESLKATLDNRKPAYLRLIRGSIPLIYDEGCDFVLGKANVIREGSDATIMANGIMVSEALKAARQLSKDGIDSRVVDMHTLKPLDAMYIEKAARETGAIVTVEEHSVIGGLGSAVSEVLVESTPTPLKRVGVSDRFGESSRNYAELLYAMGLNSKPIVEAVREVIKRK